MNNWTDEIIDQWKKMVSRTQLLKFLFRLNLVAQKEKKKNQVVRRREISEIYMGEGERGGVQGRGIDL